MKNWELVRLGDVCNLINGRAYKKTELLHEGKYHVLRVGNFFSNRSWYYSDLELDDSKYCDNGDLLYAWSASFGPRIWEGGKVIYHYHIWKTNLNLDRVNKKYLYYWFEWDTERIKATQGVGTTMIHVTKEAMKNRGLYLPAISEQKLIVAILDEAFEAIARAIANTEKNLANSRELFESYLNFKLLAVASGKPTQTLSCITELIIDCEHKTAPTQETGLPSIRTPNIGKGYLIFDNVNRVSEETYNLWTRRGKPESGDLILAREAPAGNVGVIPPHTKVCLGQRTVLIRPNKESIDSQYLAFLLLHPFMQKRLLSKSTGATVQHVNMKDIRELAISELPPIQVQRDCIKELEQLKLQVNRLETIYRQKITALKELKQSILQKAFTGELTADTPKTVKEKIAA